VAKAITASGPASSIITTLGIGSTYRNRPTSLISCVGEAPTQGLKELLVLYDGGFTCWGFSSHIGLMCFHRIIFLPPHPARGLIHTLEAFGATLGTPQLEYLLEPPSGRARPQRALHPSWSSPSKRITMSSLVNLYETRNSCDRQSFGSKKVFN